MDKNAKSLTKPRFFKTHSRNNPKSIPHLTFSINQTFISNNFHPQTPQTPSRAFRPTVSSISPKKFFSSKNRRSLSREGRRSSLFLNLKLRAASMSMSRRRVSQTSKPMKKRKKSRSNERPFHYLTYNQKMSTTSSILTPNQKKISKKPSLISLSLKKFLQNKTPTLYNPKEESKTIKTTTNPKNPHSNTLTTIPPNPPSQPPRIPLPSFRPPSPKSTSTALAQIKFLQSQNKSLTAEVKSYKESEEKLKAEIQELEQKVECLQLKYVEESKDEEVGRDVGEEEEDQEVNYEVIVDNVDDAEQEEAREPSYIEMISQSNDPTIIVEDTSVSCEEAVGSKNIKKTVKLNKQQKALIQQSYKDCSSSSNRFLEVRDKFNNEYPDLQITQGQARAILKSMNKLRPEDDKKILRKSVPAIAKFRNAARAAGWLLRLPGQSLVLQPSEIGDLSVIDETEMGHSEGGQGGQQIGSREQAKRMVELNKCETFIDSKGNITNKIICRTNYQKRNTTNEISLSRSSPFNPDPAQAQYANLQERLSKEAEDKDCHQNMFT
ncbi:unnamed protein product [Moneuplotes crassus]|uniref:Uncharacterized protein n=1 Tax=Euplotes crassus TaxID=5936 RepID=A0AAD1UKY6_EUPCR|nr:unnamed protein product [Moneuplotes crassus]